MITSPAVHACRACVLALALAVLPRAAAAAEADDAAPDVSADGPDPSLAKRLARAAATGPYFRLFATAMAGDGIRFDNPYRLSRELGSNGESLSLTAPYSDLALGATLGPPDGLQHGLHFAWSSALTGVRQDVVTPSYVALYRGPHRWMLFGRAGVPIVLGPDPNVGGELALGAAYFVTSGIGAGASIVGDGFYGAGTREVKAAFYPVLSGQLGVIVDYEVLP